MIKALLHDICQARNPKGETVMQLKIHIASTMRLTVDIKIIDPSTLVKPTRDDQ
jgi:hypothetical protein